MSDHQPNQTMAKSIKFRRIWNVQVFDSKKYYVSSPFTLQDYGKEEWRMKLSATSGTGHCCSLYLYRDEKPKKFAIDLTFKVYNRLSPEHSILKHYIGLLREENGFQSFINFSTLKRMRRFLDNIVQIICEAELKPLSPASIESQVDLPKYDLAHDFGALYNDEATADVTFTLTDKKFRAHKLILTARSTVFAAMFRNNMKETITKNVDITDLDADIFEQILRFIYTDQVSNLKDNALDLFAAADRYDLQKLKAMCEKVLHKNINANTAAEILVMADRYSAPQLKAEVLSFIKFHMKEVLSSEDYENLKKDHPRLAVELLETNTDSLT